LGKKSAEVLTVEEISRKETFDLAERGKEEEVTLRGGF